MYNTFQKQFEKTKNMVMEYEPNETIHSRIITRGSSSSSSSLQCSLNISWNDSGYSTSPEKSNAPCWNTEPESTQCTNRSSKKSRRFTCVFCKKNGERNLVVYSHNIKDEEGRVTCPVLRNYICPLCGISGDNAHTQSYCPKYIPKIADEKVFDSLIEKF